MKTSQVIAKPPPPTAPANGHDADTATSSVEAIDDIGEILHAYAVVESRSKPGNFYALHLQNVMAEKLEPIGNNGNATHPNFATKRMINAIGIRYERRGWNKP